jgi:hypothetical protein
MSYRLLFLVNAFVAFALGLGFLIVPALALDQFGVEQYASTKLVSQFFGTTLLALGLMLWFAKDVSDAGQQKGMSVALLLGAVAGLVVTVIGISPASGVIRSNGWIAILIYVLFALGYGFLVFLKPRMQA